MFVARLGSLNGLEQLRGKSAVLREFLEDCLPSADTIGRVVAMIDPATVRRANREFYSKLKRNKSLEPPEHGLIAVNFDGHESHSTYKRHCDECLERTINKGSENEKTQYYHRHVTAQLVFRNFSLLLDAEPQRSGEDEIACAIRLFERVIADYPRAFDVVNADALYAKSAFFNLVLKHKKDLIVVLKDNRRDLLKDADGLFKDKPPTCVFNSAKTQIECWDESGFLSWAEVNEPVRVVRTRETKRPIRRQLTDAFEQAPISSWTWVTTLSSKRARSQVVVEIGHSRWRIENHGFNETSQHYLSDHVYKHDPNAMLNFWLLCMTAYNIFHCFYLRCLKPVLRKRFTMLTIARELQAELYCQPIPKALPP